MESAAPVTEQLAKLKRFQVFKDSPILDLRSLADFKRGHIVGASHFIAETICDRMHELPKREQPLRLLGDGSSLQKVKRFLLSKGYQISDCLEWNDKIKDYLLANNLLTEGEKSARLWSPAPVVEWFQEKRLVNDLSRKKAIDIACGSGRDAIYLASNGWDVSVIDYSAGALEKVKALANCYDVTVKCHQIDLERQLESFMAMPDKYDLITVIRYLYRPLFPIMKQKLAPGGFLVYQTFLVGCEAFSGPKKPKFLLKPGELLNNFSGLDVVLDEIVLLPDGRPTNVFVAQKK